MRDAVLSGVGELALIGPSVLLLFAWVKWVRRQKSVELSSWRDRVILAGLLAGSISCLCHLGVVGYLSAARIGYWGEVIVATKWGLFNWPLSLIAVILAAVGRGAGRVLLLTAGFLLLLEWTAGFVH